MDFRKNIKAQGSRGLRNNNPLNVRPMGFTYQGQVGKDDKNHAIFDTIENGIRAATLELYTNYFVHSYKTFLQQVNDIAPSSDGNNVQAYVNHLKKETGIGSGDIELSGSNIEKILKAFFSMELGQNFANMIPQSSIVKGINAANKKGLQVAAGAGGGFFVMILVVIALYYAKNNGR